MIGILYDFMTASILSLAAALTVFSLVPEVETGLFPCVLTLPGALLCVLFLHLKPRGRIVLLGVVLAVTAGGVYTQNGENLRELIKADLPSFLTLTGGFCSVLFVRLMKRFRLLRLLPCLAGIGVLAFCLVRRLSLSREAVLLILLFLVLSLVEWIQAGWKKEGDTDGERHAVFTMPFLLVLFLALFLIKAPEKPFDWKIVKDLFRDIRSTYERFIQMFDQEDEWVEGEGHVGFSEESGFFSSVRTSEYEVMEVTSYTARNCRIYMSGRTFDDFDGRRWRKKDESDRNYRMYDVLETVAGVSRLDSENTAHYLRSSSLEVEYKGIRTAHVFLPGKALPVIRNRTVSQSGGDLWFGNKRTKTYTVDFFRMNRSFEGFEEFMNQEFDDDLLLDGETMKKARNSIQHLDLSGFSERGLIDYRNEIKAIYGKDPGLSAAMKELLEERLKGAESDYEKLRRVEAMLGEMEYTNKPGELPQEVNSPAAFVDYLVLHSRRGYCTHYATAFVMIARSLGFPARYVQGYCFTTSENGVTNVLSNTAHAWPEVYFPGRGWISFEPTPGFLVISGWKVREHAQQQAREGITIAVEEEEEEEESSTDTGNRPDEAVLEKRNYRSFYIPLLSALIFLALFIPADLALRRFRYGRKNGREKISYLFTRCLRILKRMGLSLQEGETLAEFARRASLKIPGERLKFIPVYEEIIYGERDVTPEDIRCFEQETRELFRFWISFLTGRNGKGE